MKTQTVRLASSALLVVVIAGTFSGCKKDASQTASSTDTSTQSASSTDSSDTSASNNSTQSEETVSQDQPALFEPAAGTGNIQGKVLFNDKPAADIQVTLNEKFSTIIGPSGKSYTARTNKDGVFVVRNVPPKEYEGLTARVFDTPMVVFMQSGIMSARKYKVEADKTLFVDPTNLFKSDLKVLAPKASATVKEAQPTFKWQAYPDAAYYKVSLYADDFKNSPGVYDQRVDGTSLQVAKPLQKDGYRIQVKAYNSQDHKIAESPDDYKFRVAP